jgi:hypothetical protein
MSQSFYNHCRFLTLIEINIAGEHFGFKPHAFLAQAFSLVSVGIDETDLNEIGFRPMRALGIEVPRRI